MEKIKLFVMDVDGTLTDGHIYIGAQGELMKAFDVKDGYAIANLLPAAGIVPVIITGRRSAIVEARAQELAIEELHQGVGDKLACLKTVAVKYRACPREIAYIGDDLNDLDCIRFSGLTACPADAVPEVKAAVNYVCRCNGGSGAAREFATWLLVRNGD